MEVNCLKCIHFGFDCNPDEDELACDNFQVLEESNVAYEAGYAYACGYFD